MKAIEKIILIIALLGAILKLHLITGGAVLLLLSMSTLSLFYYLFGVGLLNDFSFKETFTRSSYENQSSMRIIGTAVTGMAMGVLVIGILFKLMFYPGSELNILFGLIIGLVIVLVAYSKYKEKDPVFFKKIFKRVMLVGGIALVFVLIPEAALVNYQYKNHPKYIEAYEAYVEKPDDDILYENLRKEYERATLPKEMFERIYPESEEE